MTRWWLPKPWPGFSYSDSDFDGTFSIDGFSTYLQRWNSRLIEAESRNCRLVEHEGFSTLHNHFKIEKLDDSGNVVDTWFHEEIDALLIPPSGTHTLIYNIGWLFKEYDCVEGDITEHWSLARIDHILDMIEELMFFLESTNQINQDLKASDPANYMKISNVMIEKTIAGQFKINFDLSLSCTVPAIDMATGIVKTRDMNIQIHESMKFIRTKEQMKFLIFGQGIKDVNQRVLFSIIRDDIISTTNIAFGSHDDTGTTENVHIDTTTTIMEERPTILRKYEYDATHGVVLERTFRLDDGSSYITGLHQPAVIQDDYIRYHLPLTRVPRERTPFAMETLLDMLSVSGVRVEYLTGTHLHNLIQKDKLIVYVKVPLNPDNVKGPGGTGLELENVVLVIRRDYITGEYSYGMSQLGYSEARAFFLIGGPLSIDGRRPRADYVISKVTPGGSAINPQDREPLVNAIPGNPEYNPNLDIIGFLTVLKEECDLMFFKNPGATFSSPMQAMLTWDEKFGVTEEHPDPLTPARTGLPSDISYTIRKGKDGRRLVYQVQYEGHVMTFSDIPPLEVHGNELVTLAPMFAQLTSLVDAGVITIASIGRDVEGKIIVQMYTTDVNTGIPRPLALHVDPSRVRLDASGNIQDAPSTMYGYTHDGLQRFLDTNAEDERAAIQMYVDGGGLIKVETERVVPAFMESTRKISWMAYCNDLDDPFSTSSDSTMQDVHRDVHFTNAAGQTFSEWISSNPEIELDDYAFILTDFILFFKGEASYQPS